MIATDFRGMLRLFSFGLVANTLIRLKGIIGLPLLVYFFSKEDVGLLGYVQAITSLLLPFILLNMPDSANKILLGSQRADEIDSSISSVSFLILLLACVIVFFVFEYKVAVLISFLIWIKVLYKLGTYKYQVYQKPKKFLRFTFFMEYGFLLFLIFFWFIDLDISLIEYLLFYIISTFLSILINRVRFTFAIDFSSIINSIKPVLSVSLVLLPAAYFQILIQS